MGKIKIHVGGKTIDIDFSSPPGVSTIGDLIDRFNQSVSDLVMSLNDRGTGLEITGPLDFEIAPVDEDLTALQLGLVGPSHGARLFGSLEALERALLAGDGERVEAAIAEIDEVVEGLQGVEAVVTGRIERIQGAIRLLERQRLEVQSRLGSVEDVEIMEALTNLGEIHLLYQAALNSAASLFELNLLSYV